MTVSSLQETRIAVRAGLEAKERDPLAWWRFAVPRLRDGFALLFTDPHLEELVLQACNLGTKTETLAAYILACLQKRKELDGVPIPQWVGPLEGAQFVLDYKAQLLSVQPAYLRLLGKWPHHARWNGEYLSTLRIKPIGAGDDESGWSVLHFISMENKRAGVGFRLDVAGFDEPPPMEVLREVRKAAHAGRRGIRIPAFTPTVRRQWAPIREDFGDTPRRSLVRLDAQRAIVRWSLDEVESRVLSDQRKADLRRSYARDPLADAREHGDYINTSGSCAFGQSGLATLMGMLDLCKPFKLESFRAVREDEDGEPTEVTRVQVEVWRPPVAGKRYYLDLDPASGVDDGKHNPAGFLVVELGTCNLCARWNGYMAPFTLGALAAAVGRQYGNAMVDVEMKDHWGVNVIRGLAYAKYPNVAHEKRELRPGDPPSKEAGFDMNEEVRSIIIGCAQEWIEAQGAGIKYADCPSRSVIECLIDMELDERGKIVAGPGIAHAEDAVLWGRCLQKAASRSSRPIPEQESPILTPEQKVMRRVLGLGNDRFEPPAGQGYLRVRR